MRIRNVQIALEVPEPCKRGFGEHLEVRVTTCTDGRIFEDRVHLHTCEFDSLFDVVVGDLAQRIKECVRKQRNDERAMRASQ